MNLTDIIKLMRPHQYLKNLFIFLPLFFGLQIVNINLIFKASIAFIAFSLVASAIYILNDLNDIDEDRLHPTKKNRPLASGVINKKEAIFYMSILALGGLTLGAFLSFSVVAILLLYILLNIAYTLKLKHIAVLDVIIIALGFDLRIFVGTFATNMQTSMWIIVMTFLLALFLALAKRRDDVVIFNKTGKKMRKVIDGYNLQFLDMSMSLMAGVTIVAYLMYCVSPEVIHRVGSDKLYITLIFVIIGIMRYMQITFVEEASGSPTKILIKDRVIQVAILLWIITFAIILY